MGHCCSADYVTSLERRYLLRDGTTSDETSINTEKNKELINSDNNNPNDSDNENTSSNDDYPIPSDNNQNDKNNKNDKNDNKDDNNLCFVKMHIHSDEIGDFSENKFHELQKKRQEIESELSKLLDINEKLIKLMKPVQYDHGVDLSFEIKSKDINTSKQIIKLMRAKTHDQHLADVK